MSAAVARRRIEMAMLELSGELGYRAVSLEQLLSRSETTEAEFSSHFADLEACFAAAYEAEAGDLCEAMLTAAKEKRDWRDATEAGLNTALRFAAARPSIAKALGREVHIVGGTALELHEELLERLARALGEDCKDTPHEAVVPRAPSFIVGAVEGVIAGHLERGEAQGLLEAAPELMDLIATFFIGREP
jgi:AcrR family transcriptional regulator